MSANHDYVDDTFCSEGELISKPELRRELSEARLLELALLWQRFDIARYKRGARSFYSSALMLKLLETWHTASG